MKVLAISGSLRDGSTNACVLRELALFAPAGTRVVLHPPLDDLPFFNSDIEEAGILAPAVRDWRARIVSYDAVVISSPEYAHGVSGLIKNALDWLVGGGGVEMSGKPVAIVNAKPQATITHAALAETLRVMGAEVVDQTAVPLTGLELDAHGIASDSEPATLLVSVLESLRTCASKRTAA